MKTSAPGTTASRMKLSKVFVVVSSTTFAETSFVRGGPGKLDHLLRWLRTETGRMRSHGKTKEFLSSV